MSQAPPRNVDFQALAAIERELDQLIAEGRWSSEGYQALRARAVTALAGQEAVADLSFLDLVAEPTWRTGTSGGAPRMSRVPAEVGRVVRHLRRGWLPFMALPAGRTLRWNGRPVETRRVEVELRADVSRVIADVGPHEFGTYEWPVGIVRDELIVELAQGWSFHSANASLEHQQTTTHADATTATLTFRAHGGSASHTTQGPPVWVMPLEIDHSLPFGNLSMDWLALLQGRMVASSSGWGGMYLQGAYPYALVETKIDGEDPSHALVIDAAGRRLEARPLAQDFIALQFVLGQRIETGLAFGLDGTEVTVASAPWGSLAGRSRNAYPVTGPRHLGGAWAVEFFERLSGAIRTSSVPQLPGALDVFLQSFDQVLDLSFQDLLLALAALTASRADLGLLPHGTRAMAFLEAHGVNLPTAVAENFNGVAEALNARGRVSPAAPDDATIARLIEVQADLRSVVVALAAVSVDYRGPIVGQPAADTSPPWWPLTNVSPRGSAWSAAGPPEDATHGLRNDQILVFVGRPEHATILRWLIAAAHLPEDRIAVAAAPSRNDLRAQAKRVQGLGDRLVVVAEAARENIPTARDRLRRDFGLVSESIEIVPAMHCVESWMLADDALVSTQAADGDTLRRATEDLPDEIENARTIVHQLFGPPSNWLSLPAPDVYRAADRSPSLRNLLDVLARRLGGPGDLPARSVARTLSRDAIAGLIRSLLPDDATAWRTSDGSTYTAAELAREIEQGTEVGRQYAVDLASMMINALSRGAKRSGPT